MPVEIVVTSSIFYNQLKNGDTFGSNLGDFTRNQAGSVMENVQHLQQLTLETYALATNVDPWYCVGPGIGAGTVRRSSGNFYNDGFSIGDIFDFYSNWSGVRVNEVQATINSISTDGKLMNITITFGSFASASYTDAGTRIVTVGAGQPNTALIYNFGLIGNDETFNFVSKVSNNDQGYYAAGIGSGSPRSTAFVDMTPLGSYRDWVTGSARVRFVSDIDNYTQKFEIEHTYRLVPFYLDGELTNLQNNILPELFSGNNTLKYAYQMEWRTVLSNPNTSKIQSVENNLGSVAWFNENFNGFNNIYAIESVAYENDATAESASGLLISARTKVQITVTTTGVFNATDRCGVYISYLPDQSEYQDTLTSLTDNFLYDSARIAEGSSAAPTGIIKYIEANIVAGKLEIEFDTEYTTAQQLRLSAEKYFMIGVLVADDTATTANSDKVMLLADVELYDKSADIEDLMDFDKFNILQHNLTVGVDTGFTDLEAWNEDGIVIDFDFTLDLSKDAFLNTLDFALIAYNTVTGESFDLDSYAFQIAGAVVSSGVQQLEIDTTRGYILADGSQFNFVQLTTGSKVGDLQHYTGYFAQKLSWQEWIANLNADTVFFDATEPKNNLNYKTSNYSGALNYTIKLAVRANLTGTNDLGQSGLTDYLFLSPDITIDDYDSPADWIAEIKTFEPSTLVDLQGAVLVGEDTLFKVIWTDTSGPFTSLTNFWCIHRIEESDQNGYNIYEISSQRTRAANNLLKPLSGETYLKMTIVSGKIETECLVDGSKIKEGVVYNLSGRLDDGTDAPAPALGKLQEDGTAKWTEATDIKIQE